MIIRRSLYLLPLFVVSFVAGCSKGEPPIVTKAELDQIKEGMTIEEIEKVIGANGIRIAGSGPAKVNESQVYYWVNKDNSSATVVLSGGKATKAGKIGSNLP